MKMGWKAQTFLLAYICVVTLIKADINPEWRKPDAWSRHREQVALEEKLRAELNGENSLVAPRESCVRDEHTIDISKTFYMRLAKILFNDQKFKEGESGFQIRTIQFKLEKDRLQLINEFIDDDKLGELDSELLKVLKEAEGGWVQIAKEEFLSYVERILLMFSSKDAQLVIYIVAFSIVLIMVKNHCRWSKTFSFIFFVLLIGFYNHYKDCNNRKDVDQAIEFLKRKDPTKTPCDGVDLSDDSIYTYFSSKQKTCIAYMHKTSKIDTGMCRPDEVLIGYFGELYALVFKSLAVSSVEMFRGVKDEIGWLGTIGVLGMFLIGFWMFAFLILGFTVPAIFKHGFRESLRGRRQSSEALPSSRSRNDTQKATNNDKVTKYLAKSLLVALENQSQRNKRTHENRIEDVRDEETDGVTSDDAEEFVLLESGRGVEEQTNLPSDETKRPVIETTKSTTETLRVSDQRD